MQQRNYFEYDTKGLAILSQRETHLEDHIYQCVDPYTLEVISCLFPAPTNGIDFLARILRHAQIVQGVLPGLEEGGDFVAVISTRTIRVLAQSIHMAYDTTHKYVATFCALGLLHKYKHDKQRLLIFPLERYTPPGNLQALDHLIAQSRPKLQQFARGVKKRFLRLKLGYSTSFEGPAPLPAYDNSFLKTLFTPVVNLLQSEGINITQGQHIAHRLVHEVIGNMFPTTQMAIEPATAFVSSLPVNGSPTAYTPQSLPATSTKSTLYALKPATQSTKGRLPSGKENIQESLFSGAPTKKKTLQGKKSTTEAKNLQSEQKIYPLQEKKGDAQSQVSTCEQQRMVAESTLQEQESYSYDPLLDLLTLYDEMLANELTDWSQSSLPRWLIDELYENLLASYNSLTARGLAGNIPDYSWEAIESDTIQKLAAKYGYDFAALYDFLQYCTFRTDEYSPRPLLLEESTQADLGGDFLINHQKKESTLDTKLVDSIVMPTQTEFTQTTRTVDSYTGTHTRESTLDAKTGDSVAHPTKKESTFMTKTGDSCADTHRKESTIRTKTVDFKSRKHRKKSPPTQRTVDSFLCTETEESPHLTPMVDSSASEREQKYALLAKLDMTEEEINSEMGTRLLAQSVEELLGCVENYVRFKKIDEEIEAEKIEKLRIPPALNEKNYSEEFNALLRKRNIILLFNNIYNNITLRKELKVFFAEVFDTKRVKQANDWFKVVDECTVEQLCAGFIDTVVLLHSPTSKPIEKPGGFFNTRCRTLKENGLPAETLKRLDQYGEMTYAEVVSAMKDLVKRR